MNIITNTKALNTLIDSIITTGKQYDLDVHLCAVSCLQHHKTHGDITLLNRMFAGLAKQTRREGFIKWTLAFASARYDSKSDSFMHDKKGEWDIPAAAATAPWEFAPEPKFNPYKLAEKIEALAKGAVKRAELQHEEDVIPLPLLAALMATVKEYEASQTLAKARQLVAEADAAEAANRKAA